MILNPYIHGGGGGGGGGDPTDPYIANVVALLHFDGTDGSTTFIDSSIASPSRVWTANGNAQIDTAQSKFGGASGLFDGTGDYITALDSEDWHFDTGDFTIEFWIRFNSVAAVTQNLFAQGDATFTAPSQSWFGQKLDTNILRFGLANGTSQFGVCDSTTVVTTDVWYHIAYVRNGTAIKLYVDGAEEDSATSSDAVNNSGTVLAIGRLGAVTATTFNGWFDDFRITKGVARYTGNFTPPSEAFPDS